MRNVTAQVGSLTANYKNQQREQRRSFIFDLGDCLFLILVGVMASLEMHLIHMLGWHLVLALVVGMTVAMIIQTVLAVAVAPILGSIESMIPSMVAAMVIPMMVCLLDLMGINVNRTGILALGVAGGISSFVLLKAYAHRCRKCFCCEFPAKEG